MPADRLQFYLQRKRKLTQEKFHAVTAPLDWNFIEKRQEFLRKELEILEQLIFIRSQSVYSRKKQPLHLHW